MLYTVYMLRVKPLWFFFYWMNEYSLLLSYFFVLFLFVSFLWFFFTNWNYSTFSFEKRQVVLIFVWAFLFFLILVFVSHASTLGAGIPEVVDTSYIIPAGQDGYLLLPSGDVRLPTGATVPVKRFLLLPRDVVLIQPKKSLAAFKLKEHELIPKESFLFPSGHVIMPDGTELQPREVFQIGKMGWLIRYTDLIEHRPPTAFLLPSGEVLHVWDVMYPHPCLPLNSFLLESGNVLLSSGEIVPSIDVVQHPVLPKNSYLLPSGEVVLPTGDVLNPRDVVQHPLLPTGALLLPSSNVLLPGGEILPSEEVLIAGELRFQTGWNDVIRRYEEEDFTIFKKRILIVWGAEAYATFVALLYWYLFCRGRGGHQGGGGFDL